MNWYIPITLLPGISLLLLATVTLTVSLNAEIKDMLDRNNCDTDILRKKLYQLKKLTIAQTGIYISIAMFVFAGLISRIIQKGAEISHDFTNLFIALGVVFFAGIINLPHNIQLQGGNNSSAAVQKLFTRQIDIKNVN